MMSLKDARSNAKVLLENVHASERHPFLLWMKHYIDDVLEELSHSNADAMMEAIKDDLREVMPIESVLPSENITIPVTGPNEDCDKASTVHVDSFLYDEDTVDQLCDEGQLSRHYCTQCGSRKVAKLNFISHSSSVTQLKYMYQYLLPDLNERTVLDVGSRTGAVLFGGYHYSGASKIIGVELNEDFCNLQRGIVDKYRMSDRITILHSDICDQAELLQAADVIIMNNVFEFFSPLEVQQKIWHYLSQVLRRPGVLLVTTPSLECAIQPLQTGIDLNTWVKKVDSEPALKKANLMLWGNETEEESDLQDIHLYQVL